MQFTFGREIWQHIFSVYWFSFLFLFFHLESRIQLQIKTIAFLWLNLEHWKTIKFLSLFNNSRLSITCYFPNIFGSQVETEDMMRLWKISRKNTLIQIKRCIIKFNTIDRCIFINLQLINKDIWFLFLFVYTIPVFQIKCANYRKVLEKIWYFHFLENCYQCENTIQ